MIESFYIVNLFNIFKASLVSKLQQLRLSSGCDAPFNKNAPVSCAHHQQPHAFYCIEPLQEPVAQNQEPTLHINILPWIINYSPL